MPQTVQCLLGSGSVNVRRSLYPKQDPPSGDWLLALHRKSHDGYWLDCRQARVVTRRGMLPFFITSTWRTCRGVWIVPNTLLQIRLRILSRISLWVYTSRFTILLADTMVYIICWLEVRWILLHTKHSIQFIYSMYQSRANDCKYHGKDGI